MPRSGYLGLAGQRERAAPQADHECVKRDGLITAEPKKKPKRLSVGFLGAVAGLSSSMVQMSSHSSLITGAQ